MKKVFLPRHFLLSGLLLLILASLYTYFEAQQLKQVLLRQTEDKVTSLAKAMEASVKNAIVGNAMLEDLIRQRLIDNARLIDQMLLYRDVDQPLLNEIGALNRLQKIELLDEQGRSWNLATLPTAIAERKAKEVTGERRRQAPIYAWGKRWRLPAGKASGITVAPRQA